MIPRDTEEAITLLTEGWCDLLDLPGIEVVSMFLPSTRDDDETTAADTTVKWPYRYAAIRWYMPVVTGMSLDELDAIVAHELSHVLLGPLNDRLKAGSDDLCEHATENVARALLAMQRAMKEMP